MRYYSAASGRHWLAGSSFAALGRVRQGLLTFCAVAMLCLPAHQAAAATITIDFDGFAPTSPFNGGIEDGFNIGFLSGSAASVDGAFLGPFSGSNSFHNASLDFVRVFFFPTFNGVFEFSSLRAGNASGGANETLWVRGFYFDQGLRFIEERFSAPSGQYALFTATALAGVKLDFMSIDLDPRSRPIHVDDIVLKTSPVPEPATLMLVGLGMIGMGAARRRRFFGAH